MSTQDDLLKDSDEIQSAPNSPKLCKDYTFFDRSFGKRDIQDKNEEPFVELNDYTGISTQNPVSTEYIDTSLPQNLVNSNSQNEYNIQDYPPCPVEEYLKEINYQEKPLTDELRQPSFTGLHELEDCVPKEIIQKPKSEFSGKRIYFDRAAQHQDSTQLKRALAAINSDSRFQEASNSENYPQSNQRHSDFVNKEKSQSVKNSICKEKTIYKYLEGEGNCGFYSGREFHENQKKITEKMTRHMSLLEKKKKQWEEERSFVGHNGGFWGGNDVPQKVTPPQDKPPDIQYQQSNHQAYHHQPEPLAPLNSPLQQQTQLPPQNQQSLQSVYQQQINPNYQSMQLPNPPVQQQHYPQQQHQQQHHQQQYPSHQNYYSNEQQYQNHPVNYQNHQQPFPSSRSDISNTAYQPRNVMPPLSQQYVPVQIPGYGNGMYVMVPPGNNMVSPHGNSPHGYGSPAQMIPERDVPSSSSTVSNVTYWPSTSSRQHSNPNQHHRWSHSEEKSRPKWGERGVGVGHLWDPDAVAPGDERRHSEVLPPSWVTSNDQHPLPGAPMSKPGERTHARGAGMAKLDPEEIAEKQRKMKQAEENQRIIKMQLEEKQRKKKEEEEKERREMELLEKRVKEQQEREAKQYEEEIKKKNEKEEAEIQRQKQMREAIKEAQEKAQKEKEMKYDHAKQSRPSTPAKQKPNPKKSVADEPDSARKSTPKTSVSQTNEKDVPVQETKEQFTEYQNNRESVANLPKSNSVPSLSLPSGELLELNPEVNARLGLLRAIGITPELLLSSKLIDPNALISLLSTPMQNSCTSPINEDYIANRLLTPSKYRSKSLRDCSTQWSEPSDSERYMSKKRSIRRAKVSRDTEDEDDKRMSRRSRVSLSKERSRDNSEEKPPWGRHHSDRPYRKQSEKDPYAKRKFRRRTHRSNSYGAERDSATDDSDLNGTVRRRRKTWEESRQESMSSDRSRSPSPRERTRKVKAIVRGAPQIKPLLTASLPKDCTIDMAKPRIASVGAAQPLRKMTAVALEPYSEFSKDNSAKENLNHGYNDDDEDVLVTDKPYVRCDSPPVPALQNKLTGGGSFDIPEYAPGYEPNLSSAPAPTGPVLVSKKSTNKKSRWKIDDCPTSDSNNFAQNGNKNTDSGHEVTNNNPNEVNRTENDELESQRKESHQTREIYSSSENEKLSRPKIENGFKSSFTEENRPLSPPVPALAKKLSAEASKRRDSLPKIEYPHSQGSNSSTPRNLDKSRRSSLTGVPRIDTDVPHSNQLKSSPKGTSSPISITPRRLPPMASSGEDPLTSSMSLDVFAEKRPKSPPVPALARKLSASTTALQNQNNRISPRGSNSDIPLTPIEVTPRMPTSNEDSFISSSSISTSLNICLSSSESSIPTTPKTDNISDLSSRRGSSSSVVEEDIRTASVTSSGYESSRRLSSNSKSPIDPKSLQEPLVAPDKWIILKSLSSLRQNIWHKHRNVSHLPENDEPF